MEEYFLQWFWPLFSFMALVFVLKVVDYLWWRPKRIEKHFSKQGIRGPPYQFFIGNIKEIVGLTLKTSSQPMPLSDHNILPRVLSFYHHWKKIYGATFLVWFGPTSRVTISDPVLIREIFISKAEFYEKNESHPLVRKLEGDGLLTLQGEKWAHHRKIISPTFHMENVKLMIPTMGKTMAAMLDKWSTMANSDEVEIEVSEWFQRLTEEVVTRTVFGTSYEDGKSIFQLQAQQMVSAIESFQKVFISTYRFLPTKKNRDSWKLDKEISKSLVELIERRRKYPVANSCSEDLLEVMIRASIMEDNIETISSNSLVSSSSSSSSSSSPISVYDIVEECKSFFFAGKHTTANLLTWTTILLAMHPQWQKLAREEVLRVCGARDIPSKDDFSKLKTLGMILNESLRLYPPAVATIRRAKADVHLGGCMMIPRGTELLIPILAVHHDPGLWGQDANEFNPARFSQGVAHAAKHPMAFLPFGLGARRCIGQNLAILQTKLAMAMILQRFSFSLAPTYQHAPMVLMLLHPQSGAPIIFRELSDTMNYS